MMVLMLQFLPIDFAKHSQLAIAFREDSYVASFGDAKLFHEDDGLGAQKYLAWLKNKAQADPGSVVHVWRGNQIIGQMELGRFKDDHSRGYVNLFYLKPEFRGAGYSRELHWYMVDYMKKKGFDKVMLSVSPTNVRAIRYYEKNGWKDLGRRPGRNEVHLMELDQTIRIN